MTPDDHIQPRRRKVPESRIQSAEIVDTPTAETCSSGAFRLDTMSYGL
jgi:hypothetical protein